MGKTLKYVEYVEFTLVLNLRIYNEAVELLAFRSWETYFLVGVDQECKEV